MKWAVTGARGMLGTDVCDVLSTYGHQVAAFDRETLDITNYELALDQLSGSDIVINTAAYTAVEDAETEHELATRANALGPAVLSAACAKLGIPLIHISTDMVVGSDAVGAKAEDAEPHPVCVYARTKHLGEVAVLESMGPSFVVRTAWLYGEHGPSFVSKVLHRADDGLPIRVPIDQVGNPTHTRALAVRLLELGVRALQRDVPQGVYHGVSSGCTTWAEFAQAVCVENYYEDIRVEGIETFRGPGVAFRPRYNYLSQRRWWKAGMEPMTHWRRMLSDARIFQW